MLASTAFDLIPLWGRNSLTLLWQEFLISLLQGFFSFHLLNTSVISMWHPTHFSHRCFRSEHSFSRLLRNCLTEPSPSPYNSAFNGNSMLFGGIIENELILNDIIKHNPNRHHSEIQTVKMYLFQRWVIFFTATEQLVSQGALFGCVYFFNSSL